MKGHFGAVKFVKTNSSQEQLGHVVSEMEEVLRAKTLDERDKEMADLLHSCETYFRIREREGLDVAAVLKATTKKNRERGYYA